VSDRVLRAALGALGVAGAGVSAYVLAVRWGDAPLLCSTGGCETVQSSSYAEILGVPVAALGLVGYLVIAVTALRVSPLARVVGAGLALGAALFSGYLLVVQLVVIDAVCDWCVTSDAIASLAAVTALLRLRGDQSGSELGSWPGSSNPSASA
jgi:uncharacterized membrane protein